MTVIQAVDRLPRRVAGWAAARALAANSMTGISLALGLCAAVWFTAGTRPGNAAGALALGGSYLVGRSARRQPAAGPGAAAGSAPAAWAKTLSDSRLARAGATATEFGAYAGLAAGGPIAGGIFARSMQTAGPMPGWSGIWQLAITAVIVVAVSQFAVACGSPTLLGRPREAAPEREAPGEAARRESPGPEAVRREAGGRKALRREAPGPEASERQELPRAAPPGGSPWRVLAMPYGGRILLIVVAAPLLGPRGVFLGLLGWAVIAFCYAIVSSRPRRAGVWGARVLAAYRDDGLIATEIGIPVRGQLVPLPPALTGLAAVAVLAILGLRNLPGPVLLAPVVAMLLAAVGSSHPHDGLADWFVPVALLAGQFAYIGAIGVATGVPAPLIFAVCALIALHYADLAGYPRRGAIMGWEGRMIAAGLGAALGIATFAYLLLAAYLSVLICREIMTSWLPATEGDRR
jgi:hypothetical protein